MKRVLISIAAVGALVAGFAIAQTVAPQTGARVRGVRGQMMKELNLTPAQEQQAKSIFQSARQTAQPLTQQLHQDRTALRAAIQAGDNARIQQLSTEMGGLRGNVIAARSQAMAKFYSVLTPDQKTKAQEFRKNAREGMASKNGE